MPLGCSSGCEKCGSICPIRLPSSHRRSIFERPLTCAYLCVLFRPVMFRRWQPDLLVLVPLYQLEKLMRRLFPCWLLQPCWRRVYEMPVPKSPTDREGVEFRWATAADLPLIEAQLGERLTSTRLSYGHRAAILVKDSQLIGIAWFATRGYYDTDTGTRVTLSFDEAWVYGAWI